jgi:hypothetical protein
MDEARQVGASPQDVAVRKDYRTRMERDGKRILRLWRGPMVSLVRQDGDNATLRIALERRDERTIQTNQETMKDKQPGEITNTHSSASPENERYLWRELETARFEREKARYMLNIRTQALEQLRVGIANEEEHGLWEADTILSIIDEALNAQELQ